MISDKSTSPEHISNLIRTKFRKKDPGLLEKVIYALILLENLAKNKLDFVFKGGTSLILLLNQVSRFSIDIDIIVPPDKRESFSKEFDKIINETPFTRWEEDERADKGVPKQHFKWFYNPNVNLGSVKEAYILLDVLYEEHKYPRLERRKIYSDIFVAEESAAFDVYVPCVNSILGDKLTAYAPNTTGIPYKAG